MSVNFKGIDKLRKNLEELSKKTEIKFTELMNPSFVSRFSKFDCLESLFDASGFNVGNPSDFAAIPVEEWEAFIVSNTSFNSWKEMQEKAMAYYVKQQLHSKL